MAETDRSKDEEALTGHPLQEEGRETPDPSEGRETPAPGAELVKVQIGGQEFEMEKTAAAALQAQEAMFREEISRVSSRETPAPAAAPAVEEDDDDLIFTDPKGWKEKLRKELKEELQQEYMAEKSREAFWKQFYEKNPELSEYDFIVKAVMNDRWDEFQNMKGAEAQIALGNAAREQLMKIAGGKLKKPASKPTTQLEGAPSSSSAPPDKSESEEETPEDEKPKSLSQIIKDRRHEKGKTHFAGTSS